MIKDKKGAEIALNVIIFAVIGLLVLVVVIFIFSGKVNLFSKGVSTCDSLGGTCEENPCSSLNPVRPSLPGECTVVEGETPKYCCSKVVR